jgi:hypothetical protein
MGRESDRPALISPTCLLLKTRQRQVMARDDLDIDAERGGYQRDRTPLIILRYRFADSLGSANSTPTRAE